MAISPFSGPGMIPSQAGFVPGVRFEGNKSGNRQENEDAHRALQQAAGGKVDKDTQRAFHDYITGQGYTREELPEVAEEFMDHQRRTSRRFSRFA